MSHIHPQFLVVECCHSPARWAEDAGVVDAGAGFHAEGLRLVAGGDAAGTFRHHRGHIFKHYRELTTPEVAGKWFGILPKEGQWEYTYRYDRKKRRVILNGVECE